VLFRITLGFVDLAFYWNQLIGYFKPAQKGWEDRLQKQFEQMAKEEFGIEIDDTVFLG
jgi:aarF domain-containing kinase